MTTTIMMAIITITTTIIIIINININQTQSINKSEVQAAGPAEVTDNEMVIRHRLRTDQNLLSRVLDVKK